MRRIRLLVAGVFALAFVALTPEQGSATAHWPYDFCVKTGDYYDAEGTGYHLILCYDLVLNLVDVFYIPHGTPFLIHQW